MATPGKTRHKTDPPPLSVREIRFCQLWAEKGNATAAYRDAGFPAATNNAAHVRAYRLLRKRQVREYIRDIQRAAADAAMVTVEDLARGFRRAERADLRRLMGPDGEMLPPSEWPDDVALAISSIEVEELTEFQPDPENPRRKKKVAVGLKWKVKLENKTEARKVLAQWRRMVGADKADGGGPPDPLVIGGESSPDAL